MEKTINVNGVTYTTIEKEVEVGDKIVVTLNHNDSPEGEVGIVTEVFILGIFYKADPESDQVFNHVTSVKVIK